MNIIKIPFKDNYLTHGIPLGYEGENLTTEIRIIPDEIITGASYRLEFNNGQGTDLKRKDDYLYAFVKAEMLTVGDIDAQLVWTWNDVVDGEKVNKTDKSNKAHWRVLDSIKLSEDLENAYPEILNQILADIAEIKEYGGGGGSGRPGEDGEDGFSPEIIVEKVEGGYQFTITHKDTEPTVITIFNGKDGTDGKDGSDGYSPTITTEETSEGYNLTIQNKDSEPETVLIKNGKDGKDGDNGNDGFTPTVTTEETEEGYKMTITNKDAEPTVIEVKNGKNGSDYTLTEDDKQDIAAYTLSLITDGDTLTY